MVAVLAGCAAQAPGTTSVTFVPVQEIAMSRSAPAPGGTLIGVDDVLEFVYLKQYPVDQAAYRFDVGDMIELQFYTRTEAPQSYTVQPDGRIYLPELGYLTVRGLTADQVEGNVRRGYASTRLAGPVNVVARTTDAKVNEMITTLARSTNGPVRTVRVLADGTITLPFLGLVPVAGHTLAQVQAETNKSYAQLFNNLHVAVDLRESNSRRFGVMGEVFSPGIFPFQGPTTLMSALTRAGGMRDTAKPFNLIVFRPKPDGIQVTQIDPGSETAAISQLSNWNIEPSDIIYVPRSRIVDVGLFVKQYIRDVLPFGVNVGYGWNVNR